MSQNSVFLLFVISPCFLLGTFLLNALSHVALRQRKLLHEYLSSSHTLSVWKFFSCLFHSHTLESFLFFVTCSQYIFSCGYIAFCSLILQQWPTPVGISHSLLLIEKTGCGLVFFAAWLLFSDIAPRTWAFYSATSLLRCTYKLSSLVLLIMSPIVLPFMHAIKYFIPSIVFAPFSEPREHVLNCIDQLETTFGESDQRLLLSVAQFKHRIAREIMRPRVGLFCIPENLSLQQAAELLREEGYSRVPVYRDTIDTVIGIILYKDVVSEYVAATEAGENKETLLQAPITPLIKKVLYFPETKKIASLLQEFRKRSTHLAVIVDEYGGTAGLVTIEDILEEIVGEIFDEYDDQEVLFQAQPDGSFRVDARMNLLDLQEELGIIIPHEEDYDTIAGYLFYRVGSIPQAGLILHLDDVEIEIMKSNDRMVEEVKITPIFSKTDEKCT